MNGAPRRHARPFPIWPDARPSALPDGKQTRKLTRQRPAQASGNRLYTRRYAWAVEAWVAFWFRPIDPVGLHALRVLTGVLLIAWLLPFFGNIQALFGLEGWFDQQAYREAARLPVESRPEFGWSILYLCGSNPLVLKGACAGAIVVFSLFALGIATRVTAIASWVMVASFSANPAFGYDADGLLVMQVFYLMVGYVFLNQTQKGLSLAARCLGSRQQMVLFSRTGSASAMDSRPSVSANVALRLLQVHWALAMVASGLHKLQFGDWWAGVALWYPLYPPLSATLEDARAHSAHGVALLAVLSLAAYAVLAWQIAFPVFAWKPHWRGLLLGGAGLGWLGCAWLYELPLFGAVLFLGCLSYLTPVEWRRIGTSASAILNLWVGRISRFGVSHGFC